MPVFIDQLNREVEIPLGPIRIISIVPSQTELLFDLGLDEEVIGITKYCIHPATWFRNKKRVGGTKRLNVELIKSLQPDLIIGNKEENTKEQLELLASEFPVWISDVKSLDDACEMIEQVGLITDHSHQAATIIQRTQSEFSVLKKRVPVTAAYFIWNQPMMSVGHDTFISHMMSLCGLKNAFENRTRYPEISEDDLIKANPRYLLLSSEPFPFQEKHIEIFQQICPNAKILLVDGEMFSWYGSRLIKAPSYFTALQNNL